MALTSFHSVPQVYEQPAEEDGPVLVLAVVGYDGEAVAVGQQPPADAGEALVGPEAEQIESKLASSPP